MSFINVDYFKGALQIPNLGKDETAFLANYVTPYEKEILMQLLGYDLYQQVIDNYVSGTPSVWVDLVEGADYTVIVNDIDYTVHWNGLINSEEISLISYYVYYNYVQQNYQQLTGLGVGSQIMENATIVDPNQKLVWSNNECVKLSGDFEYKYQATVDNNLTSESLEPSLFNFILNNVTDYPNWFYTPQLPINILGI